MKNKIPVSPPDTANNCKAMAEEFDLAISEAIDDNKPLGIEQLLEIPFMIMHELIESRFETGVDDNTRRSVVL